MIAKIIPLKNLPSNFFCFDYNIPKELNKKIKIGQMVKIEFKKTIIFGIVFSIEKKENQQNLKTVSELVHEKEFLTKKDLKIYSDISQIYKIAISNLLKSSLLPLQKNKLKKIELNKNKISKIKEKKAEYFFYPNETKHKQIYKKIKKQDKTLIIVPEIRFLKNIEKLIPEKLKNQIVFWHSELTTKEKFENWLKIKNNEKNIIIGTRISILLPASFFNNIIIDFEQDENHKHWDAAPRFLTKDIIKIIIKTEKKAISYASYSPSFEKYFEITKNNLKVNKKLDKNKIFFTEKNYKKITIYNLNSQRNFKKQDIFSPKIEEKITEGIAKKENIFIFINRKGYSTFIECKNCNFIYTCPKTGVNLIYKKNEDILYSPYSDYKQKFSSFCPKCKSQMIEMYGIGTESVEKYIKNLTTKDNYEIIKIDSDQKEIKLAKNKNKIYIGTEKAFSFIDFKKIDKFIILDIDRQISIPEYKSIEKIWHNIAEINYFRNKNSEILIQTKNPDHFFFKSFGEKDRIYRTELNMRKKMFYPPYSYLIKYFTSNINKYEAKQKIDMVYKNIYSILTKQKINVKLTPVYEMQPSFYRGKNWYGFNIKLDNKNWQKNIKIINNYIGSDFKVDPNPINLISP